MRSMLVSAERMEEEVRKEERYYPYLLCRCSQFLEKDTLTLNLSTELMVKVNFDRIRKERAFLHLVR